MLVSFSVTNFFSIRDKVTLSLVASRGKRDKELLDNLIPLESEGVELVRTAAVYGANASGKTKLTMALDYLSWFVLNSHGLQQGQLTGRVPFKLDKACSDEPSVFEITFVAKEVRYVYGFAVTDVAVVHEYLFSYPKGRRRVVFERRQGEDMTFRADVAAQRRLEKATKANSLYLSVAVQFNHAPLLDVFEWFREKLRVIVLSQLQVDSLLMYTAALMKKNEQMKQSVMAFVERFDLGIRGVEVEENDLDEAHVVKGMPTPLLELSRTLLGEAKLLELLTIHEMTGDSSGYAHFEMRDESDGTQKLFALVGPWLDCLANDRVLVVDELDARLHPLLTSFLVKLFHKAGESSSRAQLVFTTHDANLLGEELFRRDQVWFTDKRDDGATDLHSLLDYSPRKRENLRKGYLLGRYDGIPFIDGASNG